MPTATVYRSSSACTNTPSRRNCPPRAPWCTWSSPATAEQRAWLAIDSAGVTVCRDDQGLSVDLAVEADTAQMHRWLVGRTTFRELVSKGHARLLGPSRLARAFPTWFDMTIFAEDLRRAGLREDAIA